jgi:3-hydroxy-9,10-secoandrosta-1,3,5(10)-triene-9,17-dione monooxygenase
MELNLRARIRLDTGFAIHLCYEAVDLLANAAGGSFAMENSPLNRIWRDLRTVSLNAFACPTTNLELYGRIMCGLEPNTVLV